MARGKFWVFIREIRVFYNNGQNTNNTTTLKNGNVKKKTPERILMTTVAEINFKIHVFS